MTVAILPADGWAQAVQYEVGESVPVAREADGRVLIEPHLATHPSDPDRLLGVAWVHLAGEPEQAEEHCATFHSADGGRSWHDVPQGLGDAHDGPRSLAGADGTIYAPVP